MSCPNFPIIVNVYKLHFVNKEALKTETLSRAHHFVNGVSVWDGKIIPLFFYVTTSARSSGRSEHTHVYRRDKPDPHPLPQQREPQLQHG